ncbi:MAG: polysaccharide pyruvyl transferase family protein [Lachnospiraceae bacterium]
MKKVAILACYDKYNYGSLLQAYATQKILDDMKIPSEMICIDQIEDIKKNKRKYYLKQITNIPFLKAKLGMVKLKISNKLFKNERTKNIQLRNQEFKQFQNNFRISKPFLSFQELTSAADQYSAFLVGSDQLWLPVNIEADYYTMNFVPDHVHKISFSTSFGVSSVPLKFQDRYRQFLSRIDYLSTREEAGQKIIKELTDRNAKVVCDPTLLFDQEEWLTLQKEEPIIKDKYILCYFLGNNIQHRQFAERLKKETGYKIVSLNHLDEYVKYSDQFADIAPYDIDPSDFINLIRHAAYICTDSFHGSVFSLINQKKFFTFRRYSDKEKVSTNSRIQSLLQRVRLEDRLLYGNEDVVSLYEKEIDYNNVSKILEEDRVQSKLFLKEALKHTLPYKEDKYIKIEDKSLCSGCTACAAACPKQCIKMVRDEEGFLYPEVDLKKCIECGICKNTCPILNKNKEIRFKQIGYVVNHKDLQVRIESTSGGAFTAFASYVIEHNGVVFGASFDSDFNVVHSSVETKKELKKFRNSKYVQSDLNQTFKEIKKLLNENRMVLFSGTPCQIEGLKVFLKKDYTNLLTIDFVCRAIPSPLVWQKYLEYMKKHVIGSSKLEEVEFRSKSKYSYNYSMMRLKNEEIEYNNGVESDIFLRAFFSDIIDRPSCYNCQFKKRFRLSDVTLWDCYNINQYDQQMDDSQGTTRVLIHSERANEVFKEITKDLIYKDIEVECLIQNFREMFNSVKMNPDREAFFSDLQTMNEKELFEKYYPDSLKVKAERFVRRRLVKFKSYKQIKEFVKKIVR